MTVTWTLRDGLKWSDGQPLTCDDFKYAWEWVLDKDNAGVVTVRLRGRSSNGRVPVGHRDGLHFTKIYEGYITLIDGARCRATTCEDPDQGPGRRRQGFRADDIAEDAGQRRVQVRVRDAGQELRLAQEPELHELLRPASRPTSTASSGSGTATPTR